MHNDDLITPANAGPAIRTVEIKCGAESTTAFHDIFADVGAQEGMAYLDDA